MKVCTSCFVDKELIAFIKSQDEMGECDFCKSEKVEVLNIDELLDFFTGLLNCFTPSQVKGSQPIVKLIETHWHFFKNEKIGNDILNSILHLIKNENKSLEANVYFSQEIVENVSYWEELREQLKWGNRYVTDVRYLADGELGWDSFFENKLKIQTNDVFYRGRLHKKADSQAYDKKAMYSPPKESASAGRANPLGIPYLYLCDNQRTVPYEIRATYLDDISIASFKLKKEITDSIYVSDFTKKSGLFSTGEFNDDSISKRIKSTLLKEKISTDLSKPMRRYDSELEYIPTQFICEFIKVFTGVQGIKFKSSLHDEGNNLVIFDHNVMECVEVRRWRVSELGIEIEPTYL